MPWSDAIIIGWAVPAVAYLEALWYAKYAGPIELLWAVAAFVWIWVVISLIVRFGSALSRPDSDTPSGSLRGSAPAG